MSSHLQSPVRKHPQFRYLSATRRIKFVDDLQSVRCVARNADGSQCSSHTVLAPMCAQHARQIFGIELRPSLIEGAGYGLFAVRDIPQGSIVTPQYVGELITWEQKEARYGTHKQDLAPYAIELSSHGLVWDAACHRSWAAQINHAFNHEGANARFVPHPTTGAINIRTRKRGIRAGEEILINYGQRYFHRKRKHAKPDDAKPDDGGSRKRKPKPLCMPVYSTDPLEGFI